VPVVADEEHGAFVVAERLDQHLLGGEVEVVGDLTLQNILSNGANIYFIDLDKALLRPRREDALDLMNLSRLNRSVEKLFGSRGCVTRTDRLRFLRRYLGTAPPAPPRAGRKRLRELARECASGLWFHRLWWSLSGQS
jgi:hypothetical protein